MTKVIEIDTPHGPLHIIVDSNSEGTSIYRGDSSDNEVEVKRIENKFNMAFRVIRTASLSIIDVIEEIAPDEASIEMNLKAVGEAGFFAIAKIASEAEFKISIKWTNDKKNATNTATPSTG